MQATATAHPNVALIKYWGKQATAINLPATGSLSLTLDGLHTRTRVHFDTGLPEDRFVLDGRPAPAAKVTAVLDQLRGIAGVTSRALVESANDFPTGAGLASSASGFAALVTAAAAALQLDLSPDQFANIARLGSGSAPRSLFPGIVLLEPDFHESRIRCRSLAAPQDWPLQVHVAVTSQTAKDVGSTDGMELSRATSPYYRGWIDSHPADLAAAVACVQQRDFGRLAELAEHSCLKMHALALSARPGLLYWNPATVGVIHRVRELRAAGVPVFFTVDAGPQVKAVCEPGYGETVRSALAACPGVLDVRSCELGRGAWAD